MGLPFDTTASFYGPQNAPASTPSTNPSTGSNTITAGLSGAPQVPSQPIGQISLFSGLQGTPLGEPVPHLFVFVAIGLIIYYFTHKHIPKLESQLATPRVGLGSFFSIGFQALVFIVIMKTVFTKIRIPGFSEMVATA